MSVTYTIHNDDVSTPRRICQNILNDDETSTFLDNGYVIPQHQLSASHIAELSDAVDAMAAERFPTPQDRSNDRDFAGQYIRDPHKLDPRILTAALLDVPLADTVRCLLGPRIVLRNSNIRLTHPGTGDSTVWHTDYRPHTSPPPPLASAPTVITILIYLDAIDAEVGPLFVVPRSHTRAAQPQPGDGEPDGQLALHLEPGQVVMMNAALWHRGGPNHSTDRIRRLITLQLSTVFMAEFNFETAFPSPAYQRLTEQARARQDEPLLELLGLGGVNPVSARY